MNESITYRNHTIEVMQDEYPSNPLEDWDHSSCILIYHDRSFTLYDDAKFAFNGNNEGIEPPTFSRDQIKREWADIVEVARMDGVSVGTLREFLNFNCDYAFGEYNSIEEMFNEAISNLLVERSNADRLDAIADLYNMHPEFAALSTEGRGYSQSCWHQFFAVIALTEYEFEATPKVKANAQAYLAGIAEVYRCWAYGDVFGYNVTDPDGDSTDGCWGYFGEWEGDEWKRMVQEAKNGIDHSIKQLEFDFEEAVA